MVIGLLNLYSLYFYVCLSLSLSTSLSLSVYLSVCLSVSLSLSLSISLSFSPSLLGVPRLPPHACREFKIVISMIEVLTRSMPLRWNLAPCDTTDKLKLSLERPVSIHGPSSTDCCSNKSTWREDFHRRFYTIPKGKKFFLCVKRLRVQECFPFFFMKSAPKLLTDASQT